MEMRSEAPAIGDLIAKLERATLMAKQLPNTTEPSHISQIYATLHSTHHQLTMFLAYQPTPFPQPSLLLPTQPPPPPENSDGTDTDEPMQVGDDDKEAEQNSKNTLDGVEERIKEFFVQNKRPKRSLSPSAAAEQRRSYEHEAVNGSSVAEFDHQGTKLRYLDLIYQFHG